MIGVLNVLVLRDYTNVLRLPEIPQNIYFCNLLTPFTRFTLAQVLRSDCNVDVKKVIKPVMS